MEFDTKAIKPAKIRQETLKTSLQQPVTLYPALIGFLGGVGVALFGGSILTLGALVGGVLVAGSGWAWEYFGRGSRHANRYLEAYRKRLEAQRLEAITRLRQEFALLGMPDGGQQLGLFEKKFSTFNQVLNRKLEATELTFNRYLATAEQVYLNGLDNLEKAALALRSIAGIDHQQLQDKLASLAQAQDAHSVKTAEQLQERWRIYQEQQARARALFTQNEQALTRLDQVSTQLANADLRSGQAAMDMDQAMQELTRLIETTQQYASKP